jgi:hypothetical protein
LCQSLAQRANEIRPSSSSLYTPVRGAAVSSSTSSAVSLMISWLQTSSAAVRAQRELISSTSSS